MAKKKSSKKSSKKSGKKSKKTIIKKDYSTVIVVVFAVLAIAAVALALFLTQPEPDVQEEDFVAALVDGEAIMNSEVKARYERLPAQFKEVLSEEDVLEQMVEEELLLQRAEELGVNINQSEVDAEVESLISDFGTSIEDLEASLEARGSSVQELRDSLKKTLTISKLVNTVISEDVNISSERARTYYEENREQFRTPEMVKAKHILIGTSNLTEQEARFQVSEIMLMIEDDFSNFCDLVEEYSIDEQSVEKCGEYTFPRGVMVEPFEEAAFEMDVNDIVAIQTEFGYHIIWKVAELEPGYKDFLEVEPQINKALKNEAQQVAYEEFISKLRENAEIVYNPEIPVEPEVPEVPETPETPEVPASADLDVFAQCLNEEGAVLYTAYWNSDSKKQLKVFGESTRFLEVVECGVEGHVRTQAEECQGIAGYPAWEINGRTEYGVQSLTHLAELTGCELKI